MDDTINRGILYGNYPPPGVCFTVVVQYNPHSPLIDNSIEPDMALQSNPLGTFNEAMDVSEQLAETLIQTKFPTARVVETNPLDDGCHLHIATDNETIAKIAIDTTDYRKETIH